MKLLPKDFSLYWEDVTVRLLYTEFDDHAWKLAEQIFGYKKKDSLYIYHQGKLAAYYSNKDSEEEARVGYKFYQNSKNIKKIIRLKKLALHKAQSFEKKFVKLNLDIQTEQQLKALLNDCLMLFLGSVSVHYLSQPQFFELFDPEDEKKHLHNLKLIAGARLQYTRIAWTKALSLCKKVVLEYAKRRSITPQQAESLTLNELLHTRINKKVLSERIKQYAVFSHLHKITIHNNSQTKKLIKQFENYSKISQVSGIIGNKGLAAGKVFVVKNENLDLKKLPKGMKKGMILVIQNAWPEFTQYYKLASAIVTNEGGITSHGVVVSRELNIPCVVGTKIATKIFKTGDMVEVDANKGTIRKV